MQVYSYKAYSEIHKKAISQSMNVTSSARFAFRGYSGHAICSRLVFLQRVTNNMPVGRENFKKFA